MLNKQKHNTEMIFVIINFHCQKDKILAFIFQYNVMIFFFNQTSFMPC